MPILRNARHERFAQLVAAGRRAGDAYMEAGYDCARHKARGHGHRLRTKEDVAARIRELLSKQLYVEERANAVAVERLALSKETVARELAGLAFARTGFERDDGRMDLSEVTGSHTAVLQAKRQSLMDLAKLFGWVVEKREDVSIEDRLAAMTKEQREAHAEQLAREIRVTVDRYKLIEGEAVDVTPEDEAGC
jgi:hypothetical protein